MNRKRILQIVVTASVVALALFYVSRVRRANAEGGLPELLATAPGDARFLAYADVAALRDSPLVQRLAAMAHGSPVDRDYAEFVSATGFDYQRDLDRVAIEARPTGQSTQALATQALATQTLVFAEGRFDHAKIEQYASRWGKPEREGGRTLYRVPSATVPGKTITLAFLADNRIALADGGDLSAAFAVPPATTDSALRQRISRVAGAPLFALVKDPAGALRAVAPRGGGTTFSSSFQSLRWVSVAARPEGDQVLFSAEGECDTAEQAQSVAVALEFLGALLRAAPSDPKTHQVPTPSAAAAERLLQTAKLSTDATRVRLLLTLTPQMLGLAQTPASGANAPRTR